MSVIEELMAGIDASHLSPATQELLKEFLNDHGSTIQAIGPEVLEQILSSFLSEEKADPAWDNLVEGLDPVAIQSMLTKIGIEMDEQVSQRQALIAKIQSLTAAMETLGIQVLARLLLAAI